MQNDESIERESTPTGEVEVDPIDPAVTTAQAETEIVKNTNEQLILAPLERAILSAASHPQSGEITTTLEELSNNPEIIKLAEEVLASTGRENVSPQDIIENTLSSLVQRSLIANKDGSEIISATEEGTNILTNQEEE